LAYSPAVRGELEAAGYPRDRIHDCCFGIGSVESIEGEVHSAKTQSLARNDLADSSGVLFLPAKAKLVVCTTRTTADSGWQTLLEAWPMVLQANTNAKLWFVGEPSNRGAIMARINELKLEGRVQIVGAMDSVEAVLAAADLLVAPSPHGSHVAILEAMAAGLPTVAADTTVNRWLLDDKASQGTAGTSLDLRPQASDLRPPTGPAGLLVSPGEAQPMADAIKAILNSPELAGDLGRMAWNRASRNFSLGKMLDDHLTLFESLHASKTGQLT
jgi:glycosyltransferase involved in cell wall biosynthesis